MALLGEMRRRNIFKVSLAYMILSWLIIQIANIILPKFNSPDWVMQATVLLLILAFPVAVLLSWAFELTPEGFKATADVDKTQSITIHTGKRLNRLVFGLAGLAALFLVADIYIFPSQTLPDPDVDYRRTIALFPFVNRNISAEYTDNLSNGIQADLLSRLVRLPELKVRSRRSVWQFGSATKSSQEIGEELLVGSLLQGGVQVVDDQLLIDVQFMDTRTGEALWTETFENELNVENLYDIQTEISTEVADELDLQLSDADQDWLAKTPTASMPALDAYFAGVRLLNRRDAESMLGAIDQFKESVVLDPQFGSAWTGLAETWLELPTLAIDSDPMQVRMEVTAAANRAIALNPNSANATAVLGWHQLLHVFDWEGAESLFLSALSLDAANTNAMLWYSQLLSWQGRHDEAIALARNAVDVDPLSTMVNANLAEILGNAQRWDEAFDTAEAIVAIDPNADVLANMWLAKTRARRAVDAAVDLEAWARLTNRDEAAAQALGELLVRAQTGEENVVIPDELSTSLQISAHLADIYASVGDAENTISALQAAHQTGANVRSLLASRVNPAFDFVRDDERFIALLDNIGLGTAEPP